MCGVRGVPFSQHSPVIGPPSNRDSQERLRRLSIKGMVCRAATVGEVSTGGWVGMLVSSCFLGARSDRKK